METTDYERYTKQAPSAEYVSGLAEATAYHIRGKTFTGLRMFAAYPTLQYLMKEHGATSMVDYGCGKGQQLSVRDVEVKGIGVVPSLLEGLGVSRYEMYDPAVAGYETLPPCGDGAVCVDVLRFIPLQDLPWVLDEISGLAERFVCFNLSLTAGKKPYADAVSREYGRSLPETLWHMSQSMATGLDIVCRVQLHEKRQWAVWRRDGRHTARWERYESSQLVDDSIAEIYRLSPEALLDHETGV